MSNYYSNYVVIPTENESIFERKSNLNQIELIGLESILDDFIKEYEETAFGESYTHIKNFTRYNNDSVDILDGYCDTFIFDNYAIGEVWMTENGIAMMLCADLTECFERESDEESVLRNYDIWADCPTVLIRLN